MSPASRISNNMDQYQQEMMAGQLLDLGFLAQHMPLDGIEYHLQDGTLLASQHIKREPYEIEYVGSFGNPQQQPDSRSYSCSSATSQSLSPILHDPHPELYALQMNNLPFTGRTEQLSPTTTDHSRKESDDESQRTEVRSCTMGQILTFANHFHSVEGPRTERLNERTVRGKT